MKWIIQQFVLYCLIVLPAFAQEEDEKPQQYVGFYGGITINTHRANFGLVEDVSPGQTTFGDHITTGFSAGVFFERGLGGGLWRPYFRFGIVSLSGAFVRSFTQEVTNTMGMKQTVAFTQYFTPTLIGAHADAGVRWYVLKRLSLELGLSGYLLWETTYSQYEDRSSDNPRNPGIQKGKEREGTLPGSNLLVPYGIVGLSYEIPFGSLSFMPFVRYYRGFDYIRTGMDWRVHSIYSGLSISFTTASE